jgi:hypothetical protein
MGNNWIVTSPEVYAVIWARHQADLVVFGTHTCMEGCEFHGDRHVYTEWGFRDAPYPLMRATTDGRDDGAVTVYELAIPVVS